MNRPTASYMTVCWGIFCGLLLIGGCSAAYHVTSPDMSRFEKLVGSTALGDSLRAGKVLRGMPYFVAAKIFSEWPGRKQIPVPGIGSRQPLQKFDGWHGQYSASDIRVFVDEYETVFGTLSLWYQFPDFYRLKVSVNDTLVVFSRGQKLSSVIQCLRSPEMLTVKDKLGALSDEDTLYAEIHFVENLNRASNISSWYMLRKLSDGKTFALRPLSVEYYPIEWIEFNGTPLNSFDWRGLP